MSTIVTGPSSAIQPVQIPDAIGEYSRLMQAKNAQQELQQREALAPIQQQSAQLALQQAQQQKQDQDNFRTAMQDPSMQGKTIGQIADALASKGQISQAGWAQAKKDDIAHQESLQKLDTGALDNAKKSHDMAQQLYDNVMNMPDDQVAANWASIAQQYDQIPGSEKMPLNPNQPLTKQQLQQFGPMISMGQSYIDSELARRQKSTQLQQEQGKSDPNSPFYAPSEQSVAMGTAPGAAQIQKGKQTQAAAVAGAEAAARQPYELALAAQRQALSQGDPNMAGQLLANHDATLSELKSRGATPDFIAKSLFAAKRINPNYNPQQDEAQFNVAKSPANVAFFGSAKSLTDKGGTLDQLADAAKDLPQTGWPALNSLADWANAATGSGPIAKYASLALGVADDYSKVMGGGQGSDTSRLQALNLIGAKQSPAQRAASIAGIRGAVNSQKTSRVGNNPILQRMYGEAPESASPAAGSPLKITLPSGKQISIE